MLIRESIDIGDDSPTTDIAYQVMTGKKPGSYEGAWLFCVCHIVYNPNPIQVPIQSQSQSNPNPIPNGARPLRHNTLVAIQSMVSAPIRLGGCVELQLTNQWRHGWRHCIFLLCIDNGVDTLS